MHRWSAAVMLGQQRVKIIKLWACYVAQAALVSIKFDLPFVMVVELVHHGHIAILSWCVMQMEASVSDERSLWCHKPQTSQRHLWETLSGPVMTVAVTAECNLDCVSGASYLCGKGGQSLHTDKMSGISSFSTEKYSWTSFISQFPQHTVMRQNFRKQAT